jgi:nitrite reductase/ring-hydroxylating ferredoxin subunit/uncharacterized membrane protein
VRTPSSSKDGGNPVGAAIARLLEAIEQRAALDGVVRKLRNGGQRSLQPKRLRTLLSGTPLGHPAHPMLVELPIGFWTSAMILDFTSLHQRKAARRLVGLGVLSAVPAMVTGLSDWLDTDGAEARVGLVHASVNTAAVTAYAISWWARRRGGFAGQGWSLAGAATASVGGWLGGHLAYGLGVGVDTNAFESGPGEWAAAEGTLSADRSPKCVVAEGVRIAAVEIDGAVLAMADRCSHRGGPLSEGHLSEDCLVCPWHGSAFDLRTGVPTVGPASIPQPTYEARNVNGGLEVMRREPRALRKRAVRPSHR